MGLILDIFFLNIKLHKTKIINEELIKTMIVQKNEIANLNENVNAVVDENKNLNTYIKDLKQNSKFVYLGKFTVTHYCGENYPHICGSGNGITKSGEKAKTGITISTDPNIIPLGSKVFIEGYDVRISQDTGSAIKGNKIDVYVDTHKEAERLGKRKVDVWLIRE